MPSAPAPFVSFNDYLDANAGSLAAERSQMLSTASAATDKGTAEAGQFGDAAYAQGQAAGQSSWDAQRKQLTPVGEYSGMDGSGQPTLTKYGGGPAVTSSEQYVKPTGGAFDPSKVAGYDTFLKDREAGTQALNTLGAGGLGSGKSAFEAGMINAEDVIDHLMQAKSSIQLN